MIRRLAAFAVGNPVASNLAMAVVCLAGLLFYLAMPREVFPEFSMDRVIVTTIYPGASPEDVERLVTLPLEDELESLDGLDEMLSTSMEGISTITLTLERGTEVGTFLDDARAAIERADELPRDAEDSYVEELRQQWPVMAVYVYGKVAEDELRELGERHETGLEAVEGVSSVVVSGSRDPRLWIEVDPLALERYGLSLASLAAAIEARVTDLPLGSLSTDSGDFLLRVDSQVEEAADLLELPVLALPDGRRVLLADVARPSDTFQRPVTLARFNGQPTLHLQVNKDERGDAVDISRAVHAYVAEHAGRMPPGTALGTNTDVSIYIENRLEVMRDSATIGGVLVVLSLLAFLSWRVALITALGIPVAFLGGIALAGAIGVSMNMMTMFALIIVLGMIVDDAIVVAENSFRLMEEGLSPAEAAIEGTAQVGVPVTATILTTMAAFLPILMIEGTTGQFMRPLPLIVSFCLVASLAEAILVLPAHLAHWSGKRSLRAARERPSRPWYEPLREAYGRLLTLALRWRYVSISLSLATTAVLMAVAVWWVPFNLFDDFESKIFYVNMRMPPGTSLEETERRGIAVEEMVLALPEEEVESTNMITGGQAEDATRWQFGQNLAQIWVELREDASRRRPTAVIIEDLRQRLADPPPGILSIDVAQPQAGPTGRAIDISIRGEELGALRQLADRVKASLERLPGVRDVHDDAEMGKRQVRVLLREEARNLGFSEAWLASELRTSFEGTRVSRLRRGRDDVEVVLKLPEELRAERASLEELRVTAPGGARLPLVAVAHLVEDAGPALISRDDGLRSVRVLADVNKEIISAGAAIENLREEYAGLPEDMPGYSLEFEGDYEETQEAFEGLRRSTLIAAGVIFVILGSLFRSLAQPLVIMFAIPLAVTGMILGHLIMGRSLSLLSLIGLLALGGIVVNDSLILVDRVNARRRDGEPLMQALLVAGKQRFRPIVLTSITTMLGLSPLTFFAQGQARFLQPMAISLFFGLAMATGLILVLVPCAYAVLEDLTVLARRPLWALRQMARGRGLHDEGAGSSG